MPPASASAPENYWSHPSVKRGWKPEAVFFKSRRLVLVIAAKTCKPVFVRYKQYAVIVFERSMISFLRTTEHTDIFKWTQYCTEGVLFYFNFCFDIQEFLLKAE